jgi:hypothetical protein
VHKSEQAAQLNRTMPHTLWGRKALENSCSRGTLSSQTKGDRNVPGAITSAQDTRSIKIER